MKRLAIALTLLLASCDAAQAAQSPAPSGASTASASVTGYCLPAAPTVRVGDFIPLNLVQPIANPSSTIELTDGMYFYVISMSAGTGLVTSLPSCPVQYGSRQ